MRKYSVVIAAYNGAQFIEKQIVSILNQSCPPAEVLVVDDGSTDATPEVVKALASRYPAIRFLENRDNRRGVSANFNFGLVNSSHDCIFLADQDDIWLEEKAAVCLDLLSFMEEKYGCGTPLLVFSDMEVIHSDGSLISSSFFDYQGLTPAGASNLGRLLMQNPAAGCSMLMNREVLKTALPIPQDIVVHDWWLLVIARAFGEVAFTPRALVRYRQHANNVIGARNIHEPISYMGSFWGKRSALAVNVALAKNLLALFAKGKIPLNLGRRDLQTINFLGNWRNIGVIKKLNLYALGFVRKSGFVRNIMLFFCIVLRFD